MAQSSLSSEDAPGPWTDYILTPIFLIITNTCVLLRLTAMFSVYVASSAEERCHIQAITTTIAAGVFLCFPHPDFPAPLSSPQLLPARPESLRAKRTNFHTVSTQRQRTVPRHLVAAAASEASDDQLSRRKMVEIGGGDVLDFKI